MANGMGSLYIGATGIRVSQNALNTTANNLANVDTKGYVRQQVLQADLHYLTFDRNASVSNQQAGLGVSIADVIHTRDVFLDKAYRLGAGRQAFYEACYSTTSEVQTYFQELEGQAFQDSITDLHKAFEEFAKDPSDSVNQNLVMQKASLFISRSQSIYSSLQNFQYNINSKISDDIDRINELGNTIYNLNLEITKIEAGGVETAMELRDRRDNALDELASLASISIDEKWNGGISVKLEGVDFVTEAKVYEMGKHYDDDTKFITPYWPQMSSSGIGQVAEVFNFTVDISSEYDTDVGELKGLVMQRGDKVANYTDIEGMGRRDYNNSTGMSVMLSTQAEIDQFVHQLVTTINDLYCPNTTYTGANVTGTTADGSAFTITNGMKILDTDSCAVGSDRKLPPQELFSRIGTERYTEVTVTAADGSRQTYYVYNEEDLNDPSKMYTLEGLKVNDAITAQPSYLPHLTQDTQDKQVAQELGIALSEVWQKSSLTLNPNVTSPCTFMEYYTQMIGELGLAGSVYATAADTFSSKAGSIENQRLQVIGVSSDEELTKMIQYQNAYNAASRFVNVVSEMLETLVNSL